MKNSKAIQLLYKNKTKKTTKTACFMMKKKMTIRPRKVEKIATDNLKMKPNNLSEQDPGERSNQEID